MEVVISSMILVTAVAVFFAALASVQRVSAYEAGRTRALDDLRVTAGTFAKDVRHAQSISAVGWLDPANRAKGARELTMTTYVGSSSATVRYHLVQDAADPTKWNLERESQGGSRLFVIKLTDQSVFRPWPLDVTNVNQIRRVELHMQTEPNRGYQPVVLATEVSLRNVNI